jgi:hypothetical protein
VFDSDGTFGEGTWSRDEDTWTIKQVGTLPDGKKTSATNIITRLDDNSSTWQSIDRTTDGEIEPNIEEVLVVRAPTEADVAIDAQEESDEDAPADAAPADAAKAGN